MTRIFSLAALAALLAAASPALANGPYQEPIDEFVDHGARAGCLCNFKYREVIRAQGLRQIWERGDTFTMREHLSSLVVEHYNMDVDPDVPLFTEEVHINYTTVVTPDSVTFTANGLWWDLPEATHAGRWVVDAQTGETFFATPNFSPDFPGTICPAMGGYVDFSGC